MATEMRKPASARISLNPECEAMLDVGRVCCVTKEGAMVPLPMSWEVGRTTNIKL